MDHIGSESGDVEAWTPVNYLEESGFPALLWDTLKDFGEDPVWFEDRWLVASLCDEGLTMLCGLILG
jgi:hypothetical protein